MQMLVTVTGHVMQSVPSYSACCASTYGCSSWHASSCSWSPPQHTSTMSVPTLQEQLTTLSQHHLNNANLPELVADQIEQDLTEVVLGLHRYIEQPCIKLTWQPSCMSCSMTAQKHTVYPPWPPSWLDCMASIAPLQCCITQLGTHMCCSSSSLLGT